MANENNIGVSKDDNIRKELIYWSLYSVFIPFLLPVFFSSLGFLIPDKSFSDLFMPLIYNNVYTYWAISVYFSLFFELEYIPNNFMPRFILFSTLGACVIVVFFVTSLIFDDIYFGFNHIAFILASGAIIAFSIQAKNKILLEINSKHSCQKTKYQKTKRK